MSMLRMNKSKIAVLRHVLGFDCLFRYNQTHNLMAKKIVANCVLSLYLMVISKNQQCRNVLQQFLEFPHISNRK